MAPSWRDRETPAVSGIQVAEVSAAPGKATGGFALLAVAALDER
jgi:hypothetical protein